MEETSYPKTPANTVNRYKHQGKRHTEENVVERKPCLITLDPATYDVATIHEIVNSCPVLHVSFVPDPSTSW